MTFKDDPNWETAEMMTRRILRRDQAAYDEIHAESERKLNIFLRLFGIDFGRMFS